MSKWMKQLIEAKTPAPRDVVQDLVIACLRECWQREPYRSTAIPKGLLEAMAASVLDATRLAMERAQKAPAEIERWREDARKYASDAEHWRKRAQKAEAELKTTAVACKPRFNVTQRFEGFNREQMPPPHDEARREFDDLINNEFEWKAMEAVVAGVGLRELDLNADRFHLPLSSALEREYRERCHHGVRWEKSCRACTEEDRQQRYPRIPLQAGKDDVSVTASPLMNSERRGFDPAAGLSLHEKIGHRRKMLYG